MRPPTTVDRRVVTGRLFGETALITGSTSGIGAAMAVRFAAEGAAVCVTGRNAERAESVAAAIRDAGGTVHVELADLSVDGAPARLATAACAALGDITVLVNNASSGGTDDAPVADLDQLAWAAAIATNLTAPMELCRAVIEPMQRAGHGSIINISSRQAERASRGLAGYITTKSALNGLTRSIAVDYAVHNIRCNTISPGFIVNSRRDAAMTDAQRERYEAMHLTRLGTADDVAYAAIYLAASESAFVTGINLQLDGGSSIARGATLG